MVLTRVDALKEHLCLVCKSYHPREGKDYGKCDTVQMVVQETMTCEKWRLKE